MFEILELGGERGTNRSEDAPSLTRLHPHPFALRTARHFDPKARSAGVRYPIEDPGDILALCWHELAEHDSVD